MKIKILDFSYQVLEEEIEKYNSLVTYITDKSFEFLIEVDNKKLFIHSTGSHIYLNPHLTLRSMNFGFYSLLKKSEPISVKLYSQDSRSFATLKFTKKNNQVLIDALSNDRYSTTTDLSEDIRELVPSFIQALIDYKNVCDFVINRFYSMKDKLFFELFPKPSKSEKIESIYLEDPKDSLFYPWAPLEEAWEEYKRAQFKQ